MDEEENKGKERKVHGKIVEIRDGNAIIKCRSKVYAGQMFERKLGALGKRFKEGQRVKVISGTSKGTTGMILKVEEKYAEIWTDNENTIKVHKNNLELHTG